MSAAMGRPRPFLAGVFRTACNYCVRSKKGCSGGNPCEQCQKLGKNCVYAQRRMSGPRGQFSGQSHRVRSRAKARRENRAAAKAAQSTQPAYLESSIFVKQGDEDGSGINVSWKHDNIVTGALGGHYGHHQLLLPIPQDYYHSMESAASGWRSSSTETTNESLPSIYLSDDGGYPPSDGGSVDPPMSELAKLSPRRHTPSPPAPNGSFTQCLDSTSPISEVPRQLKREATPIKAHLGVIPTSCQSGGLNLQSPVAIDDLLLVVDCFPSWIEHDSLQLERERSADLYHGGGRMLSGRVSGWKQQDLPYHNQKQQQQQQNASQEVFLWKDEDALDKSAFAAAAVAANADVSLIKKNPPPRINIGQHCIGPPLLHQNVFEEETPPVSLPSFTGGADISPATLGRRSTDNHFVDTLPRRATRQEAHVTSPIISGGTVDKRGINSVIEQVNDTASASISIESAMILMDLDRSFKVAAGTELHDEFVDLDCAIIVADMRTSPTSEASPIRDMEAVDSEVVLGANSSNDMSAFASLW